MRLIPVIDLKGGLVVRANRGDRSNYHPIESPLAPGTSDPVAITRALLGLSAAFDSIYVADIDAILGGPKDPGRETVARLSAALPGMRILIDNGAANAAEVLSLADRPAITPVIGTETLRSASDLEGITAALSGNLALSLDWRGANRLGPDEIYERNPLWPRTVIVMTLDRVGAGAGPHFQRLQQVKAMAGPREVLAAGGVRGLEDLRALKGMGCGALIATALHDGSLTPAGLEELLKT